MAHALLAALNASPSLLSTDPSSKRRKTAICVLTLTFVSPRCKATCKATTSCSTAPNSTLVLAPRENETDSPAMCPFPMSGAVIDDDTPARYASLEVISDKIDEVRRVCGLTMHREYQTASHLQLE